MTSTRTRPTVEVADIVRRHGGEYQEAHSVSADQASVLRKIGVCRTAALGGHRDTCSNCGYVRISYNSCRDRHCPKCQNLKKAAWLEARKERLIPVPYFHVVFTLPDVLNPLMLRNKRLLFNMLFSCAAQTLQTIARDKKHLGAQVGFTAVLHTWGQTLLFHPHLHCVVTGGGLSEDASEWIPTGPIYFLPVKVLGKLFRGKFLDALKNAYGEGKLEFSGSTARLAQAHAWQALIDQLYDLDWVVYAKAPFGGAEHVFRYLGRYTHRVAISNHRLLTFQNNRVSLSYRDYARGDRKRTLVLDVLEFIRRFLLHVLPKGFVRIRHFGLFAGRNVVTKLVQAKRLLRHHTPGEIDATTDGEAAASWWERLLELTGFDVFACPACKDGRLVRTELTETYVRSSAEAFDTS